jgi:exodeoxyribonuclease III
MGVRVLAINVRSGGSASTTKALVARILRKDPDVVVIAEFRDNAAGRGLRDALRGAGLAHQAGTEGHRGNGVLVAATAPFHAARNPFGLSDDEYPNAVMEADFEGLRVFGVYLPGQDRKRPHLRCLIALAEYCNERGSAALAIGDFNSGRNATDIEANVRRGTLVDEFSTADLYAQLEGHWIEAWAHLHPGEYEFSWYPFRTDPDYRSRSGWRIDKAFVSKALLPRLRSAEYDHFFRLDRLTDHSAIVVDLARAAPSSLCASSGSLPLGPAAMGVSGRLRRGTPPA